MAKLPSVMSHDFSRVPRAEIPRSSFDRSHGLKTAFDAGLLIPIFWDEALPGDTFNLNMTGFARLATPLHPFMDNVFFDTFFFFVPNRLIWTNFPKFMGEQRNPTDSTDYTVPTMTSTVTTGYLENSIFDYFDLPTGVPGLVHNTLALRAYNLIWNQWFRDQNLQTSETDNVDDGPDTPSNYALRRRGKRHDYFTSALPWPQKGDAVDIPLGSFAPIVTSASNVTTGVHPSMEYLNNTGAALSGQTNLAHFNGEAITTVTAAGSLSAGIYPSNLQADLSDATAATINQLRQAFQIQKLLERDARGGTRYTEIVRAHFNVTSPDARLQRPEYLGGGESIVNLYQVAQSSASDTEPTPQGNLAAYGTSHLSGHGFTKSFTEHGIIIGLCAVRADINYQQGLNRAWSRSTKYDYYWPALAMIGEQTILNKEIYAQGTADLTADAAAFGYQERFAEYRYKPSRITGAMRSSAALSLDTWHLAQDFSTLPLLNASFIQDNPPIDRVIAVPSEPHFIFDAFFKLRCARPMPMYGIPGLIDHF